VLEAAECVCVCVLGGGFTPRSKHAPQDQIFREMLFTALNSPITEGLSAKSNLPCHPIIISSNQLCSH